MQSQYSSHPFLQLLKRNPVKRLGGGANDAQEVQVSEFLNFWCLLHLLDHDLKIEYHEGVIVMLNAAWKGGGLNLSPEVKPIN